MQITLPDGRKATVIGQVTDKMSKIKFEDGRETLWPTDKLPKQTEGEDTLKMVVIPAIDRYEELQRYIKALMAINGIRGLHEMPDDLNKLLEINEQLGKEVIEEAKQKWGLA